MIELKFCKKCLFPETKPDLFFNEEGICSACIGAEKKDNKIVKEVQYYDPSSFDNEINAKAAINKNSKKIKNHIIILPHLPQ